MKAYCITMIFLTGIITVIIFRHRLIKTPHTDNSKLIKVFVTHQNGKLVEKSRYMVYSKEDIISLVHNEIKDRKETERIMKIFEFLSTKKRKPIF